MKSKGKSVEALYFYAVELHGITSNYCELQENKKEFTRNYPGTEVELFHL